MNKPVAWMVAEMVFTIEESAIEMAKVYGDEIIPLYTYPVKEQELLDEIAKLQKNNEALADEYAIQVNEVCKLTYEIEELEKENKLLEERNYWIEKHHPVKELTDEEIMECKAHVEVMYGCLPPLEFAWAILRKAQDK